MLLFKLLTVLAGLVVVLTVIAQLAEHKNKPEAPGAREWLRLNLSIMGLVGIGVGSIALVVGLLSDWWSVWCAALVFGLALHQLTHPDSWYEFVIKGRPRIRCQRP